MSITPGMKTASRIAATAAVAVIGLTGCTGQDVASDPYWATCDQLADRSVRADVAERLTKKVEMPALTTQAVAQRIDTVCAAEVGHYRPGLDAVRHSASASMD